MKPIYKLFLLIFLFALITSCSKEKKVSRTLTKKDGSWKIYTMEWQSVIQDTSGQSVTNGSSENNGSFIFENDNSGKYSFDAGGSHYEQSFSWSVSDENISITKISQSFDFSGNITQMAVAFSGEQTDRKTIRLEGSETYQSVMGSVDQKVFTGELILKLE